jgi:catechol 2,3-dioxygenase-like lactoylglutathione lyase family enzyme
LIVFVKTTQENSILYLWHHTSLAVRDVDLSLAFYCTAFNFSVVLDERGVTKTIESITGMPGLTCNLIQLRSPQSDHILELIEFSHPEQTLPAIDERPVGPGAAHICYHVPDLYQTLEYIKSLGAICIGSVTKFDEGLSAYCQEPGGSFLEIEELFEEIK